MVKRAVIRAVGNMFHNDQIQIGVNNDLEFYICILPYRNLMYEKDIINFPHFTDPEEQWRQARRRLQFTPLWNRQVNPYGVHINFSSPSRVKGIGAEHVNDACWAWDAGYTIKPFSFDFSVELRPEWNYHQMDLLDWYNYSGINTGHEIIKQVNETLLAKRLGVIEELPELAVAS